MLEEILKAFSLSYLPSMIKFILGPIGGYAAGLNVITAVISTFAGMMTVVSIIVYSGNWFRDRVINRLFPNRKRFSERNRKLTVTWRKYGLAGVAILTPLILTPIGGSILAVGFGGSREKILFYMALSAAFWSVVFNAAVYFFGQKLPDLLDWLLGLVG
jgi:membrane protein DedA with SNARE-associated domain